MIRSLPVDIEIDGVRYPIRKRGNWDMALDVIEALNAPELSDREKLTAALIIFYEKVPPDVAKAVEEMNRFIDGGSTVKQSKPSPRLMDWEQDFPLIVAPVNRILGKEVRSVEYLHWWTFLAAYMEINDCTFTTVISIRQKQAKHKKLEKWEQDYVREHPELVKLRPLVSESEQAYLDSFLE